MSLRAKEVSHHFVFIFYFSRKIGTYNSRESVKVDSCQKSPKNAQKSPYVLEPHLTNVEEKFKNLVLCFPGLLLFFRNQGCKSLGLTWDLTSAKNLVELLINMASGTKIQKLEKLIQGGFLHLLNFRTNGPDYSFFREIFCRSSVPCEPKGLTSPILKKKLTNQENEVHDF